jgi:hypothetical protein
MGSRANLPKLTQPHTVLRIGKGDAEGLIAVCDDGSVHSYSYRDREWATMPPIPGTKAAELAAG